MSAPFRWRVYPGGFKGKPIDLKIPQPNSNIPTLVQVADMSEQLDASITAGAFAAGFVSAPMTGMQSLWVSLVAAIWEIIKSCR